jgi:hypothetical protein
VRPDNPGMKKEVADETNFYAELQGKLIKRA